MSSFPTAAPVAGPIASPDSELSARIVQNHWVRRKKFLLQRNKLADSCGILLVDNRLFVSFAAWRGPRTGAFWPSNGNREGQMTRLLMFGAAGLIAAALLWFFVVPVDFPAPEPDIPATDAEVTTPVAMLGR